MFIMLYNQVLTFAVDQWVPFKVWPSNDGYFVVYHRELVHVLFATLFLFFFFYKNIVFPAQAEYSYFSADFRLKIFL